MTGLPLAAFTFSVGVPPTGREVLLPLLLLVPLLGAGVVAFLKDAVLARTAALGIALATVVLAVFLVFKTDLAIAGRAGVAAHLWSAPSFLRLGSGDSTDAYSAFQLTLSADAISVWLVALTAVLTPCAMLATREGIDRARGYFAWLLVLEAACIGAFISSDLLLFYVFFELTLVPSFFLIGQWGGVERRHAAAKFFIYTFAGSLFMLASILYVTLHAGTFDIAACTMFVHGNMSDTERFWVLLGLLAGLCVKVPLLPLHTWLPVTYTQAPAPVTALLSGVLAKLGTYGLLRIAIPMGLLPIDPHHAGTLSWIVTLSVLAIVYAGLIAWVQRDYKTLVAYSSISHLGFCVLALACLNTMGGQAGVLYMVNHGISTAAIFLMLGMIETRVGTRLLDGVSGLGRERPRLAFFFVLFVMSSIGLPLTNGFVSEFLAILSTRAGPKPLPILVTALATSGVVLGAVYMLHLTAKLIFGPVRMPAEAGTPGDLNGRELAALIPLGVLVLVLGVMPNIVLDSIKAPVARLMNATEGLPTMTADVLSPETGVASLRLSAPDSRLLTPH